jgi:hypothetical protein
MDEWTAAMKIGKVTYKPMITLIFTKTDVDILMSCSAAHYDGKCRQAGEYGGIIYGMNNEFKLFETDADKTEIERRMEFRDIDLLAKVTEQVYKVKERGAGNLHSDLARALEHINSEYRSMLRS